MSHAMSNTGDAPRDLASEYMEKDKVDPSSHVHPPASVKQRKRYQLGNTATIFASGSAMFSDGYSNAAIGPVNTVLNAKFPEVMNPKHMGANPRAKSNRNLLSAMAFAGMVIGQLSFGWVSDKVGRKLGMFICTGMIFVFSILCAASSGPKGHPQVLINCLIAFRFLLGIGIGGEYPCGSVTAAEATENTGVKKNRQQRLFVWATNTMLDAAFAIAWFVALVLLWIFGWDHKNIIWRGTLAIGAIPPLILIIARLFMEEPEAYKKNSMRHTRIPYWLVLKRYWLRLVAVSIVWFIYDFIVYPFGTYSDVITTKAAPNATIYETLGWSCLINAFYLPGTILGSFVSDWLGPKHTLILGLLLQAIFGFTLSGAYERFFPPNGHTPGGLAGFAVMYGVFLACGELGPGNNLGLLASKAIGPTAARGQLYGIAAAIGKVGAFIGSYCFTPMIDSFAKKSEYLGNTGIFYVGSALAVFSALVALIFIPNIKPDAMIDEDALFREYLADHGFDVSLLGEPGYVDPEEASATADMKIGPHVSK